MQRFAQDLLAGEIARAVGVVAQAYRGLAAPDEIADLRAGRRPQAQHDGGMLLGKPLHDGREAAVSERPGHGQRNRPCILLGQCADRLFAILRRGHCALGIGDQHAPGIAQPGAACHPLEQGNAELLLQ
ncbi:hypothetical protein ABH999_007292 [Bradyrhizobium yuanmingense]